MNHNSEKWEQLILEWADSLKQAKLRQAVIDDKMHSFLRGNGCLPTPDELAHLEHLWARHTQALQKSQLFMQSVMQTYHHAEETGLHSASAKG